MEKENNKRFKTKDIVEDDVKIEGTLDVHKLYAILIKIIEKREGVKITYKVTEKEN